MNSIRDIKYSDPCMNAFCGDFIRGLGRNKKALGFSESDVKRLLELKKSYEDAHSDQEKKQAAVSAATRLKNSRREELAEALLGAYRKAVDSLHLTDEARAEMGLPVRKSGDSIPSVGNDTPLLKLESRPGQVTIHFRNSTDKGRGGKPEWAKAVRIYKKTGDQDKWELVEVATKSPCIDYIEGGATTVTYMARYMGRTPADLGPESESATIAASGVLAA